MAARKTQGKNATQKRQAKLAAKAAVKNKAGVHAATAALDEATKALAKAQKAVAKARRALSGVPGGPPKINT